ncbi:MAG TPA: SPFH domain-containing protein [Caldimonas sp.]|nr:SPFH domain-containing protein [Caldimonas sp.]
MHPRLQSLVASIRRRWPRRGGSAASTGELFDDPPPSPALVRVARLRGPIVGLVVVAGAATWLVLHPPFASVGHGEVGVRMNRVTGHVDAWQEGSVMVWPGVQQLRVYPLRDRSYHAVAMARADGPAPLQSVEGLSLGLGVVVRYAIDPTRLAATGRVLPEDIGAEIVEPALQGVAYRIVAKYTVREIFSTQRVAIQKAIEEELTPRLYADGLLLRAVQIGKVDLPADYRRGMESLLAEELASEKMRYTLELKDKRVKETELEAQADRVRREVAAEAAAREQIIAAKAQEEAMKHVLPFKQRQIEQRRLEAEAEKASRIKTAEGSAQARRIEASGEADARQKLADAEAYRVDRLGKVNAEQMAREGDLISRHPLLIQKTLADKLSDKIQVIIAPPSADGGFVGSALLGAQRREAALSAASAHAAADDDMREVQP